MKDLKSISITIAILLIVSIVTVVAYSFIRNDKVAYVRTGVVLQSYKGIKSIEDQINRELSIVQSNIDTLKYRYENLNAQYISRNGRVDKEFQYKLEKAQSEYNQYKEKAEQQMEQRKNDLISNEISKINQMIELYGKKHGYKLILGSTTEGSIVYGDSAYDITDQIVEAINK
jgi:outer membrane protein